MRRRDDDYAVARCWRCKKKKTEKANEEVFGCGEGGKIECLTEVYRESAVATLDDRAERRRRISRFKELFFNFVCCMDPHTLCNAVTTTY